MGNDVLCVGAGPNGCYSRACGPGRGACDLAAPRLGADELCVDSSCRVFGVLVANVGAVPLQYVAMGTGTDS